MAIVLQGNIDRKLGLPEGYIDVYVFFRSEEGICSEEQALE